MLKTLFLGTPASAVPFLERLLQKSQVAGVVTSPDKPAGRGYETAMPAVKKAALDQRLPVLQPSSLRDPSFMESLKAWGPVDLGVVVAYGKLIPENIFSWPRLGMVNVHFSLLPKYRGAGPVQWALIRGEEETGITLFRIEKGLDSGPVFLKKALKIDPEDNAITLRGRLTRLGLEALDEALAHFEPGDWRPEPQEGEATQAPILKKEDGRIRWGEQTAEDVVNLIRGTYEWPGATAFLKGRQMKIRQAEVRRLREGRPGEIIGMERDRGFLVKCKDASILVLRVQPEGKKEMEADSFWNGARLNVGDRFGLIS
ncbi:MAG: methionyl-tRNA formyltransferase [Elusimicrobia bacterium]|nr:methionyl-tRNA formyltransferase [Elusimicrobiota bacterium]